MNTPRVSVIMPIYNRQRLLRRSVESILAQKVDDMEVILVDDGSTDGTWDILQQLAKEDSRIRPIRQQNRGVSAARNTGLEAAAGTYVRFIDSDDMLTEDAILPLIQRLDETGADLIIGGYKETIGSRSWNRNLAARDDCLPIDAFLDWMHPKSNSFFIGVIWNKLFRREVIQRGKVRFEEGLQWGEDFRFVMSYLAEARAVAFTTHVVYNYIRQPNGMTIKQAVNTILHPVKSCRMKYGHYLVMKEAYNRQNACERNRGRLWLFLIRYTLNN